MTGTFITWNLPLLPFYFLALGSKVRIGRESQPINSLAIVVVDYKFCIYDWLSNPCKVYLCCQLKLMNFLHNHGSLTMEGSYTHMETTNKDSNPTSEQDIGALSQQGFSI